MIYMCYTFIIMQPASQPALSCPEQNLRRSIERGPFAMCMYVRLNVLPWQPWAGPGWLADGRTCGCATPPGALLAFATTTRPLAGNGGWMGEGDHCATATRLPPSPPSSSSSGMQLTWDGHVRLVRATEREGVCVCVCVSVRCVRALHVCLDGHTRTRTHATEERITPARLLRRPTVPLSAPCARRAVLPSPRGLWSPADSQVDT